MQTELSRLQTRVETLERNLQETVREKEVNSLSFQAAEKELAKLRTSLYEEKMKYEKIADQSKKDLDAKEQKCTKEVNELNKIIHGKITSVLILHFNRSNDDIYLIK